MVPGIDTGGGGISNQTASSASSGNNGNTTSSSADRVSKQFININTQGARGLDLGSYLQSANAGFYRAIAGEQQAEVAQANAANRDKWLPYVAIGSAVLLGFGFMMMRGRR